MDKKEVTKTKIPHWTTTSTEGGLLLKEENRDKIEEIRNSMKRSNEEYKNIIEKVIRFHIKKRYENTFNNYSLEYVLKNYFDAIFECEFPTGAYIVGELYTTHETKDITKQEVEKYINENFESFHEFQYWVINEMCGDELEELSAYSYEDKLNYVEDNLFELLQEYIGTHYDIIKDDEFRFYDYFFEGNYDGENIILLNKEYITKWVETNGYGFSITVQLIQDALNKRFSTLDDLHKWYYYTMSIKSKENIEFIHNEINACNQKADYYEKSYNQLIQKESHYNQEVFPEVIKMMENLFGIEEVKIFCKLNAFKYRMRAGYKTEDVTKEIKKALDYEERYKNYNKK
jgi:hypothetical protein